MSTYRLFGAETSPYSLKVRSFLRYKGIDFEWIGRSKETEAAFREFARLPTVPLLVFPARPPSQDTTAMLAALEADHAEPSTIPDDPACAALALILEDYADEWLNKCMFQQRWGQMPDKKTAALRVLTQLNGGKTPRTRKKAMAQIAERMSEKLELVGAQSENWETLQTSARRFILRLNSHLEKHLFLFGGRPSAADFALAGQLQQMLLDPTPGEWMRERAPFVTAWCEFMEEPRAGGPFLPLDELSDTLIALFSGEISKTYLPWAAANMASASRRKKRFSVTLEDGLFEQSTQRYAALAFRTIKKALKAQAETESLAAFLGEAEAQNYFA